MNNDLQKQNEELQAEVEALEDEIITLKAKIEQLEAAKCHNPFIGGQAGVIYPNDMLGSIVWKRSGV